MFKIIDVLCLLIIVKNAHSFVVLTEDGPIVETNIGTIRGLRSDDDSFNIFMGIPYATVNESNIFGKSIPYPPFEGTFDAFDDSAICPQVEQFSRTIAGSLDCLHINIYVPDSATPQNLLPVMVYIHGGAFILGSARRSVYGPEYLVRHDVILVTLTYRLGPYGFMCLGIPEVPGNAGMKDQVLALRWIRDNIEAFGGDSNQVTLFGTSAGAMSCGFHVISETEKLFTKLILQSGSSFTPEMAVADANTNAPIQIAAELGFITDDLNEALRYISSVNEHAVIAASSGITFPLCVEKEFAGEERFLSELPINSNHSKIADVPVLLGFNNEEILQSFPVDAGPELWFLWELYFRLGLNSVFSFETTQLEELTQLVRRFYVGDNEMNNTVRREALDFANDFMFVYPSIRSIQPYLEVGAEKIYQYVFSYDGNRNFMKLISNITAPGAAHADEIAYQFNMQFFPNAPTPEDQLIIDRFTTMWANFAKYSDPTPETNPLLPIKWEPITKGSPYHYLDINTEMTARKRYAHRRMAFWDLFFRTYKTYEKGYIAPDNEVDDTDDVSVPDSSHINSLSVLVIAILMMLNILVNHP